MKLNSKQQGVRPRRSTSRSNSPAGAGVKIRLLQGMNYGALYGMPGINGDTV